LRKPEVAKTLRGFDPAELAACEVLITRLPVLPIAMLMGVAVMPGGGLFKLTFTLPDNPFTGCTVTV
jgi:hypothetical protein